MSRSKHPLVMVLAASLLVSALVWLLGRSLSGELEAVELSPETSASEQTPSPRSEEVAALPASSETDSALLPDASRAEAAAADPGARLRVRLLFSGKLPADEHVVVRYAPTHSGLARGATIEPDADGRFEIDLTPFPGLAPMERIASTGEIDVSLLRHSMEMWIRESQERSTEIVVNGERLNVERTEDGDWVLEDPNSVLDELGRAPSGSGSGLWIDIEARYVYLDMPLHIPLRAHNHANHETTLLAEVGGRLTGQLEGAGAAMRRAIHEGPRLSVGRKKDRILVDEDGRFDHGPVPSGEDLYVVLESDTVQPFQSLPLRLLPGETRHVTVPIRDGVLVDGVLLSDTGAELAMHTIRARIEPLDPDKPTKILSTRTDRHGRFELAGLPPGIVTIELESSHMMARSLELGPLRDGESRTGLELRARLAGRIAGTLFDVDGEARESTEVSAYIAGSQDPVANTFTDSEGRFVLQGLKELDYEIRASASNETYGRVAAVRQARVGTMQLDLQLVPSESEE